MLIRRQLLAALLVLTTLRGRGHAAGIIGGRAAAAHSRPYMVLLSLQMEDEQTQYCGGFLLNEDFVMTAAHCRGRSTTAILGLHKLEEGNGEPRIPVAQSFPHKDYNATTYRNDIMLLQLSSKANFSEHVRPIALADKSDVALPKSCLVSGWGTSAEQTKYLSNLLMEVNVTLIDSKKCAGKNLYCSEDKTGPSKGDSGGPLVCGGKAYGVVSSTFTPKSGGPKIHCFAKIPDFRGWVRSTMSTALRSPRHTRDD